MICAFFATARMRRGSPRAERRFNLNIMGKKTNNTTKTAAPSKRAAKPAAKKNITVETVIAAATKPANTVKAAPRKRTAAGAKATLSPDDVALRAYFIAEKRTARGLPGDSHSDWLDAERQVLAESRTRA